jgi:hypothetical protein
LYTSGFAAARSQWQWEAGKEYVFGYSGRILTGMPELDANHFSGLVRLKIRIDPSSGFNECCKYAKCFIHFFRLDSQKVFSFFFLFL